MLIIWRIKLITNNVHNTIFRKFILNMYFLKSFSERYCNIFVSCLRYHSWALVNKHRIKVNYLTSEFRLNFVLNTLLKIS